ncbi:MAG: ADP-glyceromanno-heptose 6-epimerase [Rhizobiaceae bacterium]|nr:ADP-glyceromanno-heptose 6-epimerase [Rhizobiaceae bacterium]
MIVVTGGAGFIGSNLVHGLNSAGMKDIVIVDSLVDARKHLNLSKAHIIDYFDKDDFPDALAKLPEIDAVFHLGACAVTTQQDGRFMMKNNYTYSKTLLHACLKRKIPFIYASSAAVYGAGECAFVENNNQEKPLNVYGFSKWAFDQHVLNILPEAQSPVIGLRYFNVYGPRESHKGDMASVIFKMVARHRAGKPLQLFRGSDTFLRDFIDVRDVVDVNLHFLQSGKSGIYNCGTGTPRSFQDLGELVAHNLDGAQIEMIDMPPGLEGQYQKYTCADGTLLRNSGYTSGFHSLEDGIRDYVHWLNRD